MDETDPDVMRVSIEEMARTVARHLGEQSIRGRTVTLKIRLAPFRTFTRSRTLPEHTHDPAAVAEAALALFDAFERDAAVRLLGVGVSNLEHPEKERGPALDAPADATATGTGPEQLLLS